MTSAPPHPAPSAALHSLLTALSTWPFFEAPSAGGSQPLGSARFLTIKTSHTHTRFATGCWLWECPMTNPPPQARGSPGKRGQERSLNRSREATGNHPIYAFVPCQEIRRPSFRAAPGVFNLRNIPGLFSAVFPPRTPISPTSWHRWLSFAIKEIKVLAVLDNLRKVTEPTWGQNQNSKLSCTTKPHPKVRNHFLTLGITSRLWTHVKGQSLGSFRPDA